MGVKLPYIKRGTELEGVSVVQNTNNNYMDLCRR
jgi:hypothetical protein